MIHDESSFFFEFGELAFFFKNCIYCLWLQFLEDHDPLSSIDYIPTAVTHAPPAICLYEILIARRQCNGQQGVYYNIDYRAYNNHKYM